MKMFACFGSVVTTSCQYKLLLFESCLHPVSCSGISFHCTYVDGEFSKDVGSFKKFILSFEENSDNTHLIKL
jgi:hypothetical protein